MFPDGPENISETTHSDEMVLVSLKGVGVSAFLWKTI